MIAYLDLPSGLSGDMLLGCLIDSGWSVEQLRRTIESLPLSQIEWAVQVQQVAKKSLRATRVDVLVEEGRHQRRLADISAMIRESTLPAAVVDRSVAIFTRLAHAEAHVHGTTSDQIHFHEVGAVDAIVDIVASVNGLHELGINQLYCSPVPLGHGWTGSAHGKLPLPAPATLELLAQAHIPTCPAPGPGELLTPTGAAILAELARFEQPMMNLSRVGVGAGQKDFDWPNIARMWTGEHVASGALVQLETNIDDMNPQFYAAVSEKLLAAGARDVWLTPVQMKKGRPGVVLAVLADSTKENELAELLLRQTTTFGVRVIPIQHRHEARREFRRVSTAFGDIQVKLKWVGQDLVDVVPEYEDCRTLADQCGKSILNVYHAARAQCDALVSELAKREPSPQARDGAT